MNKNVFERLGTSTTTQNRSRPKDQVQPTTSGSTYNQSVSHQQGKHVNSANKQQEVCPKNSHNYHSHDQTPKQNKHTYDQQPNRRYDQSKQRCDEKEHDRDYNSQQQNKNCRQTNEIESRNQDRQHKNSLYSDQDVRSGQYYNKYINDREPEHYRREKKGNDSHKRDTSCESRNSQKQNQESSVEFYNTWKYQNNPQLSSYNNNKRSHNQERAETAKRPHVEIQKSSKQSSSYQTKTTYNPT